MCFDTIPLTYVWAFGFVGFILFEIVAEGMGRSTHRFEAFLVVKYPVLGTNFCLCLQVAAEFGSCGLCPPGQDRMLLQVMPKITNPLKGVFGHAEWLILKKPCDDLANSTLCQNQNIHSACCFCHHPMHLFPNIQYLPYSNVAMENPAFTDGFPIQIPVKLGFSSSFITAGYISTYFNIYISCDWWFGTFLVFPYIGNIYIYNHPNWLSYFQRDRSITNQSSRTTSWCSARGRSACVYSHLSATASSTSTRNTTAAPAVATWTSSTPCLGVSQGRNDPVWASWYNRWFQTLKIC